jgi:hypothetical protein
LAAQGLSALDNQAGHEAFGSRLARSVQQLIGGQNQEAGEDRSAAALGVPSLSARHAVDPLWMNATAHRAIRVTSDAWTCAGHGRTRLRFTPRLGGSTSTGHPTRTTGDRSVALSRCGGGEEHQVAHALMVPFVMVVHEELGNRARSEPSPTMISRTKHDSLTVRTKRSANASRFGKCGGSRTVGTPTAASASRCVAE